MRLHRQLLILISTLLSVITQINAQNDSLAPIAIQPLVRGVYMSHSEFISNQPGVTKDFHLEKIARNQDIWRGTYNLIPRFTTNNKKVKRAWGFCDGEKTYINHEGDYFPINIIGNKMYYDGYGMTNNSKAQAAVITATTIAGGIPGAVVGTVVSGLVFDAVSKKAGKKLLQTYYIDPFTGDVIPYQLLMKAGHSFTNPTSKFYIYRYEKETLNSDSVTLILNDFDVIHVNPNEIFESNLSLGLETQQLCTADSISCLQFKNLSYEATYISVEYDAITNGWQMKEVDPNTGIWFLDKIDRQLKK